MFWKADFFCGVDIFPGDDIFSVVDFIRGAHTFREVDYFGVDIFRNNICNVWIHVRYNIFIAKELNKLFSAWIPTDVLESTKYKQPRNFCGKKYRCRFLAFYWNLPDKLVWILILPETRVWNRLNLFDIFFQDISSKILLLMKNFPFSTSIKFFSQIDSGVMSR